ncbi:MAG: AAA family ATPase, partial [Candidatus Omnitrophota bacterium]
KTTICRFFLNHVDKNVKTAFILNPAFSENQLLESIIKDFGIPSRGKTKLEIVWELNNFLLQESNTGNNLVLIIDEAQNLKPNLLEQIRLLSNLETEKDKLLQVILVGQPELNKRINLYDLRQLRQRIMVRYHIGPLDEDEIRSYINHRLKVAGAKSKIEFSDEAINSISRFSGGTPRLINMICDRALLAGFVTETSHIDFNIIKRCLDELDSYSVKTG